jgi:hypothetical protein
VAPVWLQATGDTRGRAVAPLHGAAANLARSDPWMYEMLSLVDALRVGDSRTRRLASELLRARLA